MKFETDLARAQHAYYSIPTREKPDDPIVTAQEVIARRRSLRMVTDDLIHKAFLNGDVVTLMRSIVETMTAVGGTCAQFGIQPDISDFLLASKDLVEDARVLLDKGIGVREWDQVKVGAAMMQCVVGGMCAILNLPYRAAMEMAHTKYLNAENPTHEDFRDLLIAHGFNQLRVEAANDDEPPAA